MLLRTWTPNNPTKDGLDAVEGVVGVGGIRVIGDVERHLHANGPWLYKLSRLYQEPEVTAAVECIAAGAQARRAACVYEFYAL